MKIEETEFDEAKFKFSGKTRFRELYETLERLPFKKQIKVTFDKAHANLYPIHSHFKKAGSEFVLKFRMEDKKGLVWSIAKFDLDSK